MIINRKSLLLFFVIITFANITRSDEVKWSIDGDSAKHDLGKRVLRYFGNTQFENEIYLIRGDEIEALQSAETAQRYVKIKGSPANVTKKTTGSDKMTFSANEFIYQNANQQLLASTHVNLNLKKINSELIFIGDSLTIPANQQKAIIIQGYPLTMQLFELKKLTVKASAKKLNFNQSSQKIILSGNVKLVSENRNISAEKLIYDLKKKTIEIPQSKNKRATMIQKVKS